MGVLGSGPLPIFLKVPFHHTIFTGNWYFRKPKHHLKLLIPGTNYKILSRGISLHLPILHRRLSCVPPDTGPQNPSCAPNPTTPKININVFASPDSTFCSPFDRLKISERAFSSYQDSPYMMRAAMKYSLSGLK